MPPREPGVEEATTTTNGGGDRPRCMSQSETAARKSINDYAENTPQQTKIALATNTRSRDRAQMNSATPPAGCNYCNLFRSAINVNHLIVFLLHWHFS